MNDYAKYDLHYQRMRNVVPDWELALREPQRFCLAKPWLPEAKEAKILDVGCGWGTLLMHLFVMGYRNLEGVEISKDQADIARAAAGGRVPIHNVDAAVFLKDKRECYDLVLIFDVLEHLQPETALELLKLIWGCLTKGGTIVVRVPNAACVLAAYSRYLDITHKTIFTEFSLMQILDLAGFRDHRIVSETCFKREIWRWYRPWRGLSLRAKMNKALHIAIYILRGHYPRPSAFGMNVEMYSRKILPP